MLNAVQHDVRFPAPEWVRDAIFYQIFPDRFARSKGYSAVGVFDEWGARPTRSNMCGGNLAGVREHLDYLKDLGFNALYFCPIFASNSNHRYHTYDYFKIDPVLGDDAEFDALVREAHKKGFRVILDGVFNHCSRGFFQFNSLMELGPDSPYKDWFHVESYPIKAYSGKPNYKCWWDMPALPKFNTDNPEVREFLFSVGEYWIKRGIDGWRLDVPNEIDDDSFWQEFRIRVKSINPDAYIVGEIWDPPARWLQGDQFDGVMNYTLRRLLLDFMFEESHTFEETDAFCKAVAANFSENTFGIPFNLLSSHDTTRLITQPNGSFENSKLLTALLFFMPGAVCSYYGEEIAMEGGKDPDCRRCFPWGTQLKPRNKEYFAFFKALVALRNSESALRHGKFEVFTTVDGFIVRRACENSSLELQVFWAANEPKHFRVLKNGEKVAL